MPATPELRLRNSPRTAAGQANIALLLLAAAGATGLYRMTSQMVEFGRGLEMVTIAENLACCGTYANPFPVLATGPTAVNPPLYPLLLSLAFRIFGSEDRVVFIATLVNILANALTAVLLPRVSMLFYRDLRPGVIAAVFWILSSQLMPAWDVGLTVPTLLVFCLVTAATIRKPKFAIFALISGTLAACLFLLNPVTMLIFVPWIGWLAFQHRGAPKQTVAYCSLVLGVLLAAVAGWGFRNERQLGTFAIRTSLGMTLYASDNDCASPSREASDANNCYKALHPNINIRETRLLKALGEVEYDKLRIRNTRAWVQTHRERFLQLTLARIRDFWFPIPSGNPLKSGVIWIATLLSIPGLFLMIQKRIGASLFVFPVLLIYPLTYYVVVSDIRYRFPVLWLSLLPAGFFLVRLWGAAKMCRQFEPS